MLTTKTTQGKKKSQKSNNPVKDRLFSKGHLKIHNDANFNRGSKANNNKISMNKSQNNLGSVSSHKHKPWSYDICLSGWWVQVRFSLKIMFWKTTGNTPRSHHLNSKRKKSSQRWAIRKGRIRYKRSSERTIFKF